MACVDYATWLKASQDCQAMTASVKGFGYVPAGRAALRGLGIDFVNDPALTLMSINSLNVAASSTDPCAIAQQTPCPQPVPASLKAPPTPQAACAANPSSVPCQPGGAFFCKINPTDYRCQTAPLTTVDSLTPAATAGGFNQWGLLAALAAGGAAIYLVTRKKKSSS